MAGVEEEEESRVSLYERILFPELRTDGPPLRTPSPLFGPLIVEERPETDEERRLRAFQTVLDSAEPSEEIILVSGNEYPFKFEKQIAC